MRVSPAVVLAIVLTCPGLSLAQSDTAPARRAPIAPRAISRKKLEPGLRASRGIESPDVILASSMASVAGVANVHELKEGEQIEVKVINIDPSGKVRLSRKCC